MKISKLRNGVLVLLVAMALMGFVASSVSAGGSIVSAQCAKTSHSWWSDWKGTDCYVNDYCGGGCSPTCCWGTYCANVGGMSSKDSCSQYNCGKCAYATSSRGVLR